MCGDLCIAPRHDDLQLRVNAVKQLGTIATALGPERQQKTLANPGDMFSLNRIAIQFHYPRDLLMECPNDTKNLEHYHFGLETEISHALSPESHRAVVQRMRF